MAVATTTSTISYTGTNTGNQSCPIPFIFYNETDIAVELVPASGTASTLVLNTDYVLTGTGNPSGGTAVIFSPVPVTTKIVISRSVPATQETSFQTGDRFPASVMERALDKLTMLVQQFLRASNRTLRFGPASPEQDELAPVPTSGQYVLGVSEGNLGWQTPPEVVLADGAVTNAKIADGAITSAKIAAGVSLVPDGSITNIKLAPNSVTSENIAPGTIVETDVADNSVTDAKLSTTGVSSGVFPPTGSVNSIPVLTISSKGRVTSATTSAIRPYVRVEKFAEANYGEVGFHPFLNGSIFLDSKGNLRAAGVNTNSRMGIGVDNLATNGPNFVTIPFTPTDAGEVISKFWVSENNIFVLSSTGKLYGCGVNGRGQLGVGDVLARSVLTRVGTLSSVVDFSVSQASADDTIHCLAVTSSGQLWAWGYNGYGGLGNGNAVQQNSPVQITTNLSGRTISKCYAFGGEAAFSYIIDSTGDVFSSGYNGFGQLGLGDNTNRNTFTQVPTLKGDRIYGVGGVNASVNAHRRGSVFIVRNGSVWATGSNVNGTLGYGDTTDKNGFVQLSISNVVSIAASCEYAANGSGVCALLSNGSIRVWGNNSGGMIGMGAAANQLTPAEPSQATGILFSKAQFIGSQNTGGNLALLDTTGRILVTGYRGRLLGQGGAIGVDQTTLQPVRISSGVSFDDFRIYGVGGATGPTILAKTTTGELWAWGNNNNFQCGSGAGVNISVPQLISI
jgi:alpha-tubulin suppressor-like RCC1 family protein